MHERKINEGLEMNSVDEKQKELINKIETEYEDYLSKLEKKSVHEIISESERTSFYADIVFYLREKKLNDKEIQSLNQKNALEKAYKSYLKNDYKYLDTMRNHGRLLYQFAKEQQSQM